MDSFLLVFAGGRYQIIGHPEWDEQSEAPSEVDVDDLAAQGWVRITGWDGKQRNFAVTAEGRAAWDEHVEQFRPEPDAARVTLDWPSPEPVLRQIFDAYEHRGAPRRGVDVFVMAQAKESDDRAAFNAYVRELARFGYLDVITGTVAKPRRVSPSPTALQMLAGWPSGAAEDVLEGLARAIGSEIKHTTDPARRSLLESVRSGLLGGARDVALHYLEKKMGV